MLKTSDFKKLDLYQFIFSFDDIYHDLNSYISVKKTSRGQEGIFELFSLKPGTTLRVLIMIIISYHNFKEKPRTLF